MCHYVGVDVLVLVKSQIESFECGLVRTREESPLCGVGYVKEVDTIGRFY